MINLCIDAGNSKVKQAVISNSKIVEKWAGRNISVKKISDWRKKYPFDGIILTSVRNISEESLSFLKNTDAKNIIELSHTTKLPFSINYEQAESLGKDRIAAAAYAQGYHNQNCIIIDTGTCITIDLFDKTKGFMGGSILPGLHMRFKALHNYTDKLPLLSASGNFKVTGNSTNEAINSGVMFGTLLEIQGFINYYKEMFKEIDILLTGGDMHFFETQLKNKIFANSDLVMLGLDKILYYNAT
ncbi:MAG: type III pantothenate kinase [Chitinophagaceae bacterium]|nr:MAG: type III pantothenate kinase [Chitinophagaceae bacterium]